MSEQGSLPATCHGCCGVIEDLPTGWRGIVYDLGVSLGLVEPTPGEKAYIARRQAIRGPIQADNSKEAGS